MAGPTEFLFTTGSTFLPDVGILNYNGCVFSPLFETGLSGNAIKDEAGRTVKYTEVVLTADGYVTLQAGTDISPTMVTLHRLLTAQGGALVYKGRGFDLIVNGAGATVDAAWGPAPELIEFQPLGGGLSAKVKWKLTLHITSINSGAVLRAGINAKIAKPTNPTLLQFNYDTSVSYGEDGFSSLSMRGTLEIPLTRANQTTRTIGITADDYRSVIQSRLLNGIDLSRFRVVRREFNTSRDKRTLTWDFMVEEKPYMDLPPDCTIAHGSYNVRPAKVGPGLALWLCTLQATYTLRNDVQRREAYLLFLTLLRLRMAESVKGDIPPLKDKGGGGGGIKKKVIVEGLKAGGTAINPITVPLIGALNAAGRFLFSKNVPGERIIEDVRRAILLDFSINEGLYLDSKTVSFSATWRICTNFSHILVASGLWAKVAEKNARGENLWAGSVRDISGTRSWLENKLDPSLDVIVDFGSTD